jgi:maleylpyruvate isomerase
VGSNAFEQTFAILASWHKSDGGRWMVAMDTNFPHLDETVVATARYLEALTELDDEALREPSLLPGWTRAHVVGHVSRNADALARVLHGAQEGEVRAMYDSQEQRDADIEATAGWSAERLRADAVAAAGRWHQAANELHAVNLDASGRSRPESEPWPVRRVGAMRRTEVEVHHADLGIGYTAADWPEDLVTHLLKRRKRELEVGGRALTLELSDREPLSIGTDGPTVSGSAADVLWWLLGRGSGDGLACSDGQLPDIGRWI